MTRDSQPKPGQDRNRRAEPRQNTNLRTVATIEAHQVACQVVNLSRTGALVTTGTPVRLGQVLTIEIPGLGPASCRVQRVTSSHFAVIFEPAPARHARSLNGGRAIAARPPACQG